MKTLMVVFSLAVMAACGSDGGGSGTFSCDTNTAGSHGCTEYSYSGGTYPTTAWRSSCTQAGGTAGTACTHTGSVGACKISSTSGAITVTTTVWYYTGTASSIMTACSASNGTFVTP